ncbi:MULTISPECIES: hypothetical protein [unclassified Chelatococcus]|uniref:hypothetical protein n=1 Tax=unclassified Chelatococcus TaxID=2638111 RepID=UPI001BCCFA04|nr:MULTISPECIES: hypothetical protein [unclassified Chelatococcus]MBS7741438.1 hypothetical protein [Chelatococcus sp. HY11]MBX3544542.1 hypothetical protein [Chelatococcus sp.]MCO5078936.1 hypothetical protein [Chelatococcus sp.]
MRVFAAIAGALLLAGCQTAGQSDATVSDWKIEQKQDEISGKVRTNISATTVKVDLTSHSGIHAAVLGLSCTKGAPSIMVYYDWPVGTTNNAAISYRFDDAPGVDVKNFRMMNLQAVVIDNKAEVSKFLSQLPTARTLYFRVSSPVAGQSNALFGVRGGSMALDALNQECSTGPA